MKNTYIIVDTEGVLVKTNETTSIDEINSMIKNKAAWISKKIDIFKAVAINKDITTGSRLYYLGKSYYVHIEKAEDVKEISIDFTHSKFKILAPLKYSDQELNIAIEKFYKEKAAQKIIPITNKWSKQMNLFPEHISFRYSKNRWASCSSTNRISFNYHLIKLSSSLIEYVVVHELSHIKHQDHSKGFWKLVHHHLPDYKAKEEKIRIFERLF